MEIGVGFLYCERNNAGFRGHTIGEVLVMTLGIMQPYFFPYLGYFDLINCSDKWIVFDTVQYIRHGWMNRNRIHHPTNGDLYIIVPIKKTGRSTLIKDVIVSNNLKWRERILGQLRHYKKKAPYYKELYEFVEDCLLINENYLSRFNTKILEKTCLYLGIKFDYEYFSEMDLGIEHVENPGDWALRISEALGAKEYVNPPGGTAIFDPEKFNKANIKLVIRNIPTFEYACGKYEFVPNLSIIDVLMFNSVEKIQFMLKQFQLVEKKR